MIGRMPAATAFSMIEVVGKQNSVVHALPLQDFDDGVGGPHDGFPHGWFWTDASARGRQLRGDILALEPVAPSLDVSA